MRFVLRRPLYYLALLAIGASSLYFHYLEPAPVALIADQQASLKGMVDSQVKFSVARHGKRRAHFVLKSGGQKILVYVRGTSRKPSYGDEVRVNGCLVSAKGQRNPGGFNQREYLAIRGIGALLFVDGDEDWERLSTKKGWPSIVRAIHRFREFLSEAFHEHLARREAGFMSALIFGERSDIDIELKDHFMKTGTLHLLAVSGFNVGFVVLGVWFLARLFWIPKDTARMLTLIAVWVYCVVVGWQAPVLRATIMASLFILASFLGRKSDILNTLGAAALLILVVSPRQVMDLGFQLSFAAVWAISVFIPAWVPVPELFPGERRTLWDKARRYGAELFWVSFICLIATLPLTVQAFYTVTPAAVLTNMIVVPMTFVLFCLGVLYLFTYAWMPAVTAECIAFVSGLLIKVLAGFEHLPFGYVIVGQLSPWILTALLAGLAWLMFDKKITKSWVRAVIVSLFCLNMFMMQEIARGFEKSFSFTMLDVGQGDALYFKFPKGNMLIDAGKGGEGDQGRYVITPFLKRQGVRHIDILVISHPQEDHIGGAVSVIREFNVRHVVLAGQPYDSLVYKKFLDEVKNEKAKMWTVFRGSVIDGYPGVSIKILHPHKYPDYKNINNASVVLEVSHQDHTFLLTGDIEESAMKELAAGFASDIDVFKVPHHGARLKETGREWVRSLRPEIALISAGERNRYGHPHPDTLGFLQSLRGVQIHRTDTGGAAEVRLEGGELRMRTGEAIA